MRESSAETMLSVAHSVPLTVHTHAVCFWGGKLIGDQLNVEGFRG